MKKLLAGSVGLAFILAAVSTGHSQTVAYDNSTTLLNPPGGDVLSLSAGSFVGNTITLATGTSRTINGFAFEYYANSSVLDTWASAPTLTVSFYLNNGALVNGVPAPNPLGSFWNETFTLDNSYFTSATPIPGGGNAVAGNINFTSAGDFGGGVAIPGGANTITWTVQVNSGLGAGDQFGLLAFDPPTVGADANYYWQYNGSWNTYTNSIPGANSFGAEVLVAPEPGTVALFALGGLTLLAAVRRRQCQ
jgi:hypothetical protein